MKVVFGALEFVGDELGDEFKEAPPFDLVSTFKDSSARTPIVFVLTSGSDPIQSLLLLAKSQVSSEIPAETRRDHHRKLS